MASAKLPENGPCIVPSARKYVQRSEMVSVGTLTNMREERGARTTCSAHGQYRAPASMGNAVIKRGRDHRLDHSVVQVWKPAPRGRTGGAVGGETHAKKHPPRRGPIDFGTLGATRLSYGGRRPLRSRRRATGQSVTSAGTSRRSRSRWRDRTRFDPESRSQRRIHRCIYLKYQNQSGTSRYRGLL